MSVIFVRAACPGGSGGRQSGLEFPQHLHLRLKKAEGEPEADFAGAHREMALYQGELGLMASSEIASTSA